MLENKTSTMAYFVVAEIRLLKGYLSLHLADRIDYISVKTPALINPFLEVVSQALASIPLLHKLNTARERDRNQFWRWETGTIKIDVTGSKCL